MCGSVIGWFLRSISYQSEAEAIEALSLRALRGQPRDSDIPGERPADLAVALQVERLVEEPALDDPEEAFLAAIKLAENPDFLEARQRLFDWEDALYIDDWEPDEVATRLKDLEGEYNAAVQEFTRRTRRRRAVSLLPAVGGALVALAGHPHAKGAVSKALSWVTGRFVPLPGVEHEQHPGRALALVRATYRD